MKNDNEYRKHYKETISTGYEIVRIPAGQTADGRNGFQASLFSGSEVNTTTTHSELIECVYMLVVKAYTDGRCKCCSAGPKISRELIISPKHTDESGHAVGEPGASNRTVMPLVRFPVSPPPTASPPSTEEIQLTVKSS